VSKRVVTRDIPVGDPGRGVYAYRVGDSIDTEAVEANGWQDYVSGPSTKTAQRAVASATGEEK
jgi:hypothetical protein